MATVDLARETAVAFARPAKTFYEGIEELRLDVYSKTCYNVR